MKRTARQRKIDGAEVSEHVGRLLEGGYTYTGISRLTGVHPSVVKRAHMRTTNPRTSTRERILGLPTMRADAMRYVPAWRTQRLIAELKRGGVTNDDIAAVLQRTHKRGLTELIGPEVVALKTFERFATLYRYYATQGIVPACVLDEVGAP